MSEIAIEQVKPNPDQPRKQFDEIALQELAESIQEIGLLNPILVRPNGSGYEVVHGERRLRACKLAGLDTIRAEVRELDDEAAFLIAFTENLQRDDLNAMEEAEALRALMDKFGYSQAETGRRIGKSQPWISGRLALLKLPDDVQGQVITRVISPSAAREISRIDDNDLQLQMAAKAAEGNLTVRELEAVPKESNSDPDWENWSLDEAARWCRRQMGLDQYPPPDSPPDKSMRETIIWARQRLDYLNANPTGNTYLEAFYRNVVDIHLRRAEGGVIAYANKLKRGGKKLGFYVWKRGNLHRFFLVLNSLIANTEPEDLEIKEGEIEGTVDVRHAMREQPESKDILLELGWIDDKDNILHHPKWTDVSYMWDGIYHLFYSLASRQNGEPLPKLI